MGDWTPDLVIRVNVAIFRSLPVLYSRPIGCAPARADEWSLFAARLITISARTLGPNSLNRLALLTRTRRLGQGGPSIREVCRERYGWRGSRSALYRRSARAAATLAAELNRLGVRVPAGIAGGTTATPSA